MSNHAYEVICSDENREEWLEHRKTGLGSSDMPAILGVSTWKSALALFGEKIGAFEPEDISDKEYIKLGHALEGTVADIFEDRTRIEVERWGELIRSKEHPWAMCTPDYFTVVDGVRIPVEIKTVGSMALKKWEDGVPPVYGIQVQEQVLVTGAPFGYIAALTASPAWTFMWGKVERDEEIIQDLIKAGTDFWRRIQENDPPLPDGSDSSSDALKLLFPVAKVKDPVSFPTEVMEWDEELLAAKATIKEAGKTKKLLENKIKGLIGDASEGVCADGTIYRLGRSVVLAATIHRKEFTQFRLTRKAAK